MTPYYERTLSSFADQIITRVTSNTPSEHNGLFYAVLDIGSDISFGPDFVKCGKTPEEAIAKCAAVIRQDAQGIGKFAPHSILTPCYDFRWRLCKWWAEKEQSWIK